MSNRNRSWMRGPELSRRPLPPARSGPTDQTTTNPRAAVVPRGEEEVGGSTLSTDWSSDGGGTGKNEWETSKYSTARPLDSIYERHAQRSLVGYSSSGRWSTYERKERERERWRSWREHLNTAHNVHAHMDLNPTHNTEVNTGLNLTVRVLPLMSGSVVLLSSITHNFLPRDKLDLITFSGLHAFLFFKRWVWFLIRRFIDVYLS